METQPFDPIISEVWAVRDARGARFDHDMGEVFRDIRTTHEMSGRNYVRYPSRSPSPTDSGTDQRDCGLGPSAANSPCSDGS